MNDAEPPTAPQNETPAPVIESPARDLDLAQAHLAYSIIESLLEHTQVVSDLVALMAQVLDEETTKALTNTPHWKAYLESRRKLEHTRNDVEKFALLMQKLVAEE